MAVTSAVVSAIGVGVAAASSVDAHNAQKKSRAQQAKAQQEAEVNAIRQRRENEMERRRADQKTPDLQDILARQQKPKSSLLTGGLGSGVGGNTLLGG